MQPVIKFKLSTFRRTLRANSVEASAITAYSDQSAEAVAQASRKKP
jgi:hypothetical protein